MYSRSLVVVYYSSLQCYHIPKIFRSVKSTCSDIGSLLLYYNVSLLSFIVFVLLITSSVEGASYCMADYDSNGHKLSLYLQYCDITNSGKIVKIHGETERKITIFCSSIPPTSCPAFNLSSCSQLHKIYPTAPSGYYKILLSNGSQVDVYCDMEGSQSDGEGGWTRVVFLKMREPGSSCPPALVQYDIINISLCWINGKTSYFVGCNSAFFSTYGLDYTKNCGQVRGYQYGYPYAFLCYINNDICFDPQIKTYGVTLAYGNNPRKHIWTYAGGYY